MAHLASLAPHDRLVHGALILAFAILAAYLAGCCLLTAAMLLDGFVMPQLA